MAQGTLAPVFSAFDRPIYQSLIPRHIFDVLSLPDCVRKHLQQGCFSVRFSSSEWHGVALDECHEMKINKDAKMAVTRPSVHKMEHISNHLQFQAACVNNLCQNIAKSKSSIDFFLSGCKCKTGCSTRICSCRKKERKCGPSCSCHFCKNTSQSQRETRETCANETDLVVNDLLEENCEDTYVEESDDDLEEFGVEEMNNDEELQVLMEFVFGPEMEDEEDHS